MWARWLNIFLGIWLVAAPIVLGYPERVARLNDAAVGLLVACLTLASSLVPVLRFAGTALGAWLIVAPVVLAYGDSVTPTANDIVVGALVLCFSLVSAERETSPRRTGRHPLQT
ncbi:SPW repeat domain-containing protein [Pyxidicoccus xibeiensis]|uniref:SPW repeat domain-containing protein n=1 Tax=Pyxidicoccus xibeiensis TaxID=2906759 RepID=UPI0020A6E390|nr:SPW repeat protein [Pyxidicoccus xibeiensis]MCP3137213.1 SPW repeat protein [Pyxidicoccus xibeiensis]